MFQCLQQVANYDVSIKLAVAGAKELDKDGNRLFQDGDKAALRREVEANILQEIQLAMIEAGQNKEVKEAKAELKSE